MLRVKVTIKATAQTHPEACWKAAVTPEAIMAWNAASPEWHCPRAEVDLRVGGRMTSRMEARDGSAGFEFSATFTTIEEPHHLQYQLDDDRMVDLHFETEGERTHITQTFDAEEENDVEFQRAGWQSILDNFARFAETN